MWGFGLRCVKLSACAETSEGLCSLGIKMEEALSHQALQKPGRAGDDDQELLHKLGHKGHF